MDSVQVEKVVFFRTVSYLGSCATNTLLARIFYDIIGIVVLLLELSHESLGGVDHLRGYHGPRGSQAEAPGRKNSGILLLRSKPMFSQKLKREPLSH